MDSHCAFGPDKSVQGVIVPTRLTISADGPAAEIRIKSILSVPDADIRRTP